MGGPSRGPLGPRQGLNSQQLRHPPSPASLARLEKVTEEKGRGGGGPRCTILHPPPPNSSSAASSCQLPPTAELPSIPWTDDDGALQAHPVPEYPRLLGGQFSTYLGTYAPGPDFGKARIPLSHLSRPGGRSAVLVQRVKGPPGCNPSRGEDPCACYQKLCEGRRCPSRDIIGTVLRRYGVH